MYPVEGASNNPIIVVHIAHGSLFPNDRRFLKSIFVTIQLISMKKMLDRVLLHFFCFHL